MAESEASAQGPGARAADTRTADTENAVVENTDIENHVVENTDAGNAGARTADAASTDTETTDTEVAGIEAAGALGARRVRREPHVVGRVLARVLSILLGAVLVGDLAIVIANVFERELFHRSIAWEESTSELALLAIGFIGGAVALCNGENVSVDYFVDRFGHRFREGAEAVAHWVTAAVSALVFVWAAQNYPEANAQTIAGLSLSQGIFAIVLAIAMGCVAVVSVLEGLTYRPRLIALGLGAIALAGLIAFAAAHLEWVVESAGHGLLLCTVVALVAVVLGFPLTVALLLFVALFTYAGQNVSAFVPLGLEGGLSDFVLLSIPFFILAGYIMSESGLGKAIIDLLAPVLSRLPGGNLQLAVGTMFVFSGLSGAKVADVTAVGSAMSETLAEDGFDRGEVASVLAVCAAAGETVPPSVALLILGTITSISIGTLFVAGVVPALLIMALVGILIAVRDRLGIARSDRTVTRRRPTSGVGARVGRGLAALGLPVVLLGGIETGIFTATEAAAIAVLYAVIVASLPSPTRLTPRHLWKTIEGSAVTSGMVLLLVAIANTVGEGAALAQVPQSIAQSLAGLGDSQLLFLLITIIVVPIAGALLEGIPAILIFGPLLVPAAQQLNINLVHYGIVFVLSLGLGAFSPLLGVGFYVACKVAGARVSAATRRYLPYFGVAVVGIVVVAFVPAIALWLPQLLHEVGA
jgi:tripartite ATP-independent transporter DctM subunit